MSLLSQLALHHAGSVLAARPAASTRPDIPAMPLEHPTYDPRFGGHDLVDHAKMLTLALLADQRGNEPTLARLEAGVDEYVDVWTPELHTTTRFELISALTNTDDAVTDVTVTFTDALQGGVTALLVWFATGRFTRPAFFDDENLVEPTGAVIRVAGATSVSFTTGRRADRIRCYYDRLSVIEQMSNRPATGLRA